jgi:hypothetical protein
MISEKTKVVVVDTEQLRKLLTECIVGVMRLQEKEGAKPVISQYLDSKEASLFLKKSPNALRVMVHKNQIKSMKKGNSLYFHETDLVDYLESGRRQPYQESNTQAVLTLARVAGKKKGATN